ncbi:MAG: SRPBCC family protein, partial [Candidatus Eisenbacteria bacterium]|nr:SRPBCC family protein [Candidatus Eisenbacteria bacterium]
LNLRLSLHSPRRVGALAATLLTIAAAGCDFEFRLREGGEARGTIRTFLPGRHLRLVWEENGVRSLLGLSFWPTAAGCMMTLTQRSYGIDEGDRARVLATWEARFARLREAIERPVATKEAQGSGSIALTQIVLADPAETYRCFTDPGRLIGWFCDRAEFTASVDHPFAFLWTGYGENRGVVEDLAPGERLRLRWEVAALHATTMLSIQLAPAGVDGSSTQVSLRHTGFPGDDVGEGERAAHEAGWRSFLSLLDVYLREYGRGPRRSFLLRRRLQLSASDAVARLTTSEGLASWLGAVVALDARDDGAIRVKLPDGTVLGGRFAMLSPEIGLSLELEEPEMLFLSVWWEGTDHQISVALEGIAYGVPESWPLRQRIVWGERLDRLAGLA